MKRKIILAIAICLIVFVAVCVAFMFHDAGVMGRSDWSQSRMNSLAVYLELYRDDHGKYPTTLTELVAASDAKAKEEISLILQNSARLSFEYKPSTNGFAITVTGIDSWRPKQNALRKECQIGEALK